MKIKLIYIYAFLSVYFSYSFEFEHLKKNDIIRLEKVTSLEQFHRYIKGEDVDENIIRISTSTFGCSLYGLYVIKKCEIKLGIISLSNGIGTYYESLSESLGYADGSWIDINVFLDPEHVGKGYFGKINKELIKLIEPFIGLHHTMPSHDDILSFSSSPFKGVRGLIELTNIISLRACLKNGGCLIDIAEQRDAWIIQYPPKIEYTDIEKEIRRAADTIIEESLASFAGQEHEKGTIVSTEAARESVGKHYFRIFSNEH